MVVTLQEYFPELGHSHRIVLIIEPVETLKYAVIGLHIENVKINLIIRYS